MRFDAIVIGTGQAGPPLARALADKGWTVAIVEGGTFGGSCVNYGCTPSKAMIGSAYAIHTAQRGSDFGFAAGGVTVDFARIIARRDAIVTKSRTGLTNSLEKRDNITLYRDYATFESAKSIRVGDQGIESDHIFINTGTRAFIPPIDGLDSVPYLDNVSLMALKELPKHLIIIGGGYIGLEFGQAFRRFGCEITIIDESPRLLTREDPDFSKAMQCVLEKEKIHIVLDAKASRVDSKDGKLRVHVTRKDGSAQTISGSHLLVAVGRRPNSDQLGVDKAGIELDDQGFIKVDDHLHTNIEGVYALGDVNGRGAFTHTSYNDYQIAESLLLGDGHRKVSDRITIYAMFTDPPLARVGMSETEVRQSGKQALMAIMPMTDVARGKEFGQTEGFMKVLVDAESKQFLGATIFGLTGDEVIHSFADLMYAKAPYTVMGDAVHIHPTVSELLITMMGQLKPLE